MVRRLDCLSGSSSSGFREQMIDALVFSLAVYESCPSKVLSVLRCKYDLPVGALDLLHLPDFPGGSHPQPIMVGRSTHGHVVVACRGTSDLWDVIQDLKFVPRGIRGVRTGTAHMGFVERAETIALEPLLNLLAAGHRLVFTGHSLGGAVSALLALRFLEAAEARGLCTHRGQVQCITFGAPLFASSSLADLVNDKYRDVYCHVVSKNDVVPRLVPLVALLQRLWGGGGAAEPMEALHLTRLALGLLQHATSIPFASALQVVENLIPAPLRLLLGGACQLLWPARTPQQYVFAGNFLLLDPMAEGTEGAVRMAQAEDLRSCMREASFALEIHFDVFNHHLLSTYQTGVTKSIRSRLLARFSGNSGVAAAGAAAATGAVTAGAMVVAAGGAAGAAPAGAAAVGAAAVATCGAACVSHAGHVGPCVATPGRSRKSAQAHRLRRTRSDMVTLEGRVAPFLPIMQQHRAAERSAAGADADALVADPVGAGDGGEGGSVGWCPSLGGGRRSVSFRQDTFADVGEVRGGGRGAAGADAAAAAGPAAKAVVPAAPCAFCKAMVSVDPAAADAAAAGVPSTALSVCAPAAPPAPRKRRWRFGCLLSSVFRVSHQLRCLSKLSVLIGAVRLACGVPLF